MSDATAIKELSRIAFDMKIPNLQKRVYSGLVASVICNLVKGDVLTTAVVKDHLFKMLGLKDLPDALILLALEGFEREGTLTKENEVWKVNSVTTISKVHTDSYDVFLNAVVEKITIETGPFDDYQRVAVDKVLEQVLFRIFDEMGSEVSETLGKAALQEVQQTNLGRVVKDTISSLGDAYIHNAAKLGKVILHAVVSVLEEASEQVSEALWRMGSAFVMLRIVAADPELTKLRREAFREGMLVLDTSVILDILCEECEGNDETCVLLRSCSGIGFKIAVQKCTEDELNRTFVRYTWRYQAQKGSYFDPAFAARDVPKTFYRNKSRFSDWYAFIAHLKTSYVGMKREHKIIEVDIPAESLNPQDLAVASHLVEIHTTSPEKIKDSDSILHDALSILAVHSMRRGIGRLAGPWFLTGDRGVVRASEEFSRKENRAPPAAISCQTLLNLVAPFLSSEVQEKEIVPLFSRILKSRIMPLSIEDVKAFVAYTFDQAGIDCDTELISSVTADAHSSRTFEQSLYEFRIPEALQELKEITERGLPTGTKIKEMSDTIERLVSSVKGTADAQRHADLAASSGLASLVYDIDKKLRMNIQSKDHPADEMEVQSALNSLLSTLEYDFTRSKVSVDFSVKGNIPDFVVRIAKEEFPVEVKFVDSTERVSQVVQEMAGQHTTYRKHYKIVIFVVYDCGHIADVAKFGKDFELLGDIVLIVKH